MQRSCGEMVESGSTATCSPPANQGAPRTVVICLSSHSTNTVHSLLSCFVTPVMELTEGVLTRDLNRKLMSVWICLLSYGFSLSVSLTAEEIGIHLENGRILLSEGKYSEALTHYQAAVEADRKNYLTFFKRATVLLALGRHRAALDDLNEVVQLKPDFLAARSQRGVLLFKMGRLDEAHMDLEWVLRLDPHNEEASHLYSLIDPVKHDIQTAQMLLEDGQPAEAADILTQVLNHVSWDMTLREMRAQASEQIGDLVSAISDLRVTTRVKSDDTDGLLRLSLLHYKLGEAAESLVTIRECLKLDQDHKECFRHYKKIKKVALLISNMNEEAKAGSFAECVTTANSVLKHDSSSVIQKLVKAKKCHCLNKNGDVLDAIVECTEALKLDEQDIYVRCDRAEAYLENEDYDEAISDYQKVLSMDPNNQRADEGMKKAKKLSNQRQKKDYYKILGVKRSASKREVTKAYRKLAHKWHPDNFQTEVDKKMAEKKFMDIASAKEVLVDDEKRAQFDRGDDPLDPESQANRGFHGFHPHGFGGQGFTFKFNFG